MFMGGGVLGYKIMEFKIYKNIYMYIFLYLHKFDVFIVLI